MVRRPRFWLLLVAAVALGVAGCGSSSASQPSGAINFAVFNPFSGPDAQFGPEDYAGCEPAALAITRAGGILGHTQVSCNPTDTRGDPADAVPAAQQLLASDGGLVGIIGPTSDESSATVPIFNRSHMTMFDGSGQVVFDQNHFAYFWRITPPDDAVGYAMALYAHQKGYTRVAGVFGADISSQGAAPTVKLGFEHLGGVLTIDQRIPLDQSSYRSEVLAVAASHPQAIFTEADPQTSATYLSEMKQLGHLVPIIGTNGTVQVPWQKAVSHAIGASTFAKDYVGAQPYTASSGPAYAAWIAGLHAARHKVQAPVSQWYNDPYAQSNWDGVSIMALAMEMSHSTRPAVYNKYIPDIVAGGSNAVVVHTFASGKSAIEHGRRIRFVGATGPVVIDRYHNSPGGFEVTGAGGTPVLAIYTAADLAALKP